MLVDYIFDWARDSYREDIIQALRAIATGDNDGASVVCTDSDIFSTRHVDPFEKPCESENGTLNYTEYVSAQSSFVALDSSKGAVRHAALVESKYCCVYITEDNVQTLLLSIQPNKLDRFCSLVLTSMTDSILLDQPGLDAMEEQWTGTRKLRMARHHLSTRFHTVVTCTSYLSPHWHQVRELFVIAIAERAWSAVVTASKLKSDRGKTLRPKAAQKVEVPLLAQTITRLRCGTPREVLLSCITRRALRVKMDVGGGLTTSFDNGTFRGAVHFVYRSFKRGILEPQESFLRTSSSLDQQHKLIPAETAISAPFHDLLQVSDDGCVLVAATCMPQEGEDGRAANICVYLVDGEPRPPTEEELAAMTKRTFETRDVYHTTRNHGSLNINNLSIKNMTNRKGTGWNISNSYGISSVSSDFLYLIEALGAEPPATQGSPRPPAMGNSARIYRRNISHWLDLRLLHFDRRQRMFSVQTHHQRRCLLADCSAGAEGRRRSMLSVLRLAGLLRRLLALQGRTRRLQALLLAKGCDDGPAAFRDPAAR